MSKKNPVEDLEHKIVHFYEAYSAKRVALATFIVGIVTVGVALSVYAWLGNGLIAAVACFTVGFLAINVVFLSIIPPAQELKSSRDLICAALREPNRIRNVDTKKVQVADANGKVHVLKPRELSIWQDLVVPFLVERQIQGDTPAVKKAGRRLTASERRYIEEKRKEVQEMEANIETERKRLAAERSELELRSRDLKQAEEVVIARLNGVEQAQAELEQLRISIDERANEAASEKDSAVLQSKERELKAKEAELERLKVNLKRDRASWELQKGELQELKASLAGTSSSSDSDGAELGLKEREATLEKRQKAMEAEAEALAKRASFVTNAENSLIDRLDKLSEREANVEQSEINAGLRRD